MSSKNLLFSPDAVSQRAAMLYQSGQLEKAAKLYKDLIKRFPKRPTFLTDLGTITLQLGNIEEGVRLLERSLDIAPDQAMAYSNCGIGLQYLNRFDEALACYDRALALNPQLAEAWSNRGFVLHKLKRLAESLDSCDRAIALQPNLAQAHVNRSSALKDLCRLEEALLSADRALALNSRLAEAHINRGAVLKELTRFDEALASFVRAIALNPKLAEAHSNHGSVLNNLGRFDEALASFARAIALQPDMAEAHNGRGGALNELGRPEEAIASIGNALAQKPDLADAHNNLGLTFDYRNRLDEALASFDRAIALDPAMAGAYWNKALLKLLQGDFDEGWKLYEWRWKGESRNHVRHFSQPLWLGQPTLAGKTLLIWPEQGLGDFIQFCRYAKMAEESGATVVLETPASLVPVVSTLKGNFTVVATGDPLPAFDFHCPVMSLPLAWQTTVETIPATDQYLYADPGKQAAWRERLGNKTRPRIGLAWSGSTDHKRDRHRSVPFELLEPLWKLPIDFHVLQKEIRADDVSRLAMLDQVSVHNEELTDFSDTAALIQEMDLVISVDTSVAHLAGALGKPVWILLPFKPDYRWMLGRADTPWYPSATLMRQPSIGDWPGVMAELMANLKANTLHRFQAAVQ
jgi:tetratricopeptide (TPR) repeat protein